MHNEMSQSELTAKRIAALKYQVQTDKYRAERLLNLLKNGKGSLGATLQVVEAYLLNQISETREVLDQDEIDAATAVVSDNE